MNTIWEWLPSYLHQIFRYSIINWGYGRAHLLKGRHYVLLCSIVRKISTYKLHMIRHVCESRMFIFLFLFHAIGILHFTPTRLWKLSMWMPLVHEKIFQICSCDEVPYGISIACSSCRLQFSHMVTQNYKLLKIIM